MNIKDAEKIINDYGKVMEKSASLVFAAPISILPHSKEDIKEAIKTAIIFSKPNDDIKALTSGYTNLAKYIDDKKACIAILGQEVIEDETKRDDIIKNNKTSKNYELYTESLQILEETNREHEKLLKELNPTLDYFFNNNSKK